MGKEYQSVTAVVFAFAMLPRHTLSPKCRQTTFSLLNRSYQIVLDISTILSWTSLAVNPDFEQGLTNFLERGPDSLF